MSSIMLLAIATAWIAAGIAMIFLLHTSWRIIPMILSFGVGLLYLRGALGSLARRAGADP